MAENRNAQIRYKILDNCFRNTGKRYFMKDLQEECEKVLLEIDPDSNGISDRQLFEDIKFMESAEGWSIKLDRPKDGKRVYYRYEDPSYSIFNMPLNEVEVLKLKNSLELLSQIKGMQQFDWVHDLIEKLNQRFKIAANNNPIVEFDNNSYLKGKEEFFSQLYDAILYKKVLQINYKPFGSIEIEELCFHPYYLKQFNNRWYLFGLNEAIDKSDWNIAIDRIVDIKVLDHPYKDNKTINWSEHFDNIVGVTFPYDTKVENIELHFIGKTINYVLTKPLHHSQKGTKVVDDILKLRLKLMINYEFESLILSFGENVEVIKPESLRTAIKKRLRLAIKNYK